jgi:hypothetical protein
LDSIFIEGIAATFSAVIIFCGGVFLLLTMVVGARLSYFITASITLGFVFLLALVWSFTNQASPLGPVGTLPSWDDVAIGEDQASLEFGAAEQYPDAPWKVPNEDDQAEVTRAAELESDAGKYLEEAIEAGRIEVFQQTSQAQVSEGSTRLLEQDDAEYGALTFEPLPAPSPTASPTTGGREGGKASPSPAPSPTGPPPPPEDARVYVVMRFDPGTPLGTARVVLLIITILLVLHLFGLSRAERRSRRITEPQREPAG